MSRQPRRPREVIQKEKDEKAAAQQARADAKLLKEAGKERATRLEQEKMATSALQDVHIPRRLPVNKKGMCKIVPSVLLQLMFCKLNNHRGLMLTLTTHPN
jgi:hypothetical protein